MHKHINMWMALFSAYAPEIKEKLVFVIANSNIYNHVKNVAFKIHMCAVL